jgi:hypothetical protein
MVSPRSNKTDNIVVGAVREPPLRTHFINKNGFQMPPKLIKAETGKRSLGYETAFDELNSAWQWGACVSRIGAAETFQYKEYGK